MPRTILALACLACSTSLAPAALAQSRPLRIKTVEAVHRVTGERTTIFFRGVKVLGCLLPDGSVMGMDRRPLQPRGVQARPPALAAGGPTLPRTLEVPADFATIQGALDASAPGDTVLVSPGTYAESVVIPAWPVTLSSVAGADVTTIQGDDTRPVVRIAGSAGLDTVVRGFTLTGGRNSFLFDGSGISVDEDGSPLIEENIIRQNAGSFAFVSAVSIAFSDAVIRNNVIADNVCRGIRQRGFGNAHIVGNVIARNGDIDGSGITLGGAGNALIERNVIENNGPGFAGFNLVSDGGGIRAFNSVGAIIVNNVFIDNFAGRGSAVMIQPSASSPGFEIVSNTMIERFAPAFGSQGVLVVDGFAAGSLIANNVIHTGLGPAGIHCRDTFQIQGPGLASNLVHAPKGLAYSGSCAGQATLNGNLERDPRFQDPLFGDFSLAGTSPGIDAGNSTLLDAPFTLDVTGAPRFIDDPAVPDTGQGTPARPVVDIGAYESQRVATTVTFDGAPGAPLENGLEISAGTPLTPLLSISGLSSSGHPAALFDTSPAGPNGASSDPDLLVDRGNALILQENSLRAAPGVFASPDDDAEGGVFTLEAAGTPLAFLALDLIDICPTPGEGVRVELVDRTGRRRTYDVPAGFTEDITVQGGSGHRTLDLLTLAPQAGYASTAMATEDPGFDPFGVLTVTIELAGSGAIDNVVIAR